MLFSNQITTVKYLIHFAPNSCTFSLCSQSHSENKHNKKGRNSCNFSTEKKKEGEKKLVVRLQLRKEVKSFFLSVSCVSAVLEILLLLCVVTETSTIFSKLQTPIYSWPNKNLTFLMQPKHAQYVNGLQLCSGRALEFAFRPQLSSLKELTNLWVWTIKISFTFWLKKYTFSKGGCISCPVLVY